jgi:hypothetical protein
VSGRQQRERWARGHILSGRDAQRELGLGGTSGVHFAFEDNLKEYQSNSKGEITAVIYVQKIVFRAEKLWSTKSFRRSDELDIKRYKDIDDKIDMIFLIRSDGLL